MKHLHKLIGYGIEKLQVSNNAFTDSRLNPNGFVFCKNKDDDYHLRFFFNRLLRKKKKWTHELFTLEIYQPYIHDCVHLVPEAGIIAIVPPDKSHMWHRKDDIIDAIIECEFFDKQPNCGMLKNNIIP